MIFESTRRCRICGRAETKTILNLGKHPPANSLRRAHESKPPRVPLTLAFCSCCKTVQLKEAINPKYLFSKYVWVTGTSSTARAFSYKFYREVAKRAGNRKLFVMEVASNDGTFLKPFKEHGHRILGVDPARNIVQMANRRKIQTLAAFYGVKTARQVVEKHGKADVLFARNVVPHVKNIHDVIAGINCSLKDDGIGIIEFHYAQKILDGLQYDSIYHEHLFYFSIQSLSHLLKKYGFHIYDAADSPMSGGSKILFFSKRKQKRSLFLKKNLIAESRLGINRLRRWKKFAAACLEHRKKLKELMQKELSSGKRITGYGASARSSTLLNFCGLNHSHMDCVADQSEIKHGRFTAGSDIRILPPAKMLSTKPDVILLLAWNFEKELLEILKSKYRFKGKVILPLPNKPVILNKI